jgi:class 3 adenylate cyclase/tetratricopeptide (TPR) repeat protein
MTKRCQLCGFENTDGVRFCGGCGAPLTVVQVEEERRRVAVLFADICNFTRLVAASDPEEAKDLVDRLLGELAERVTRAEGIVEKFIGDAVMAVFGVPRAHENDAERAIAAGLELINATKEFAARHELELAVRVGVHYGEVIVARQSRAPGRAHQVFGHTVNVAARLEESGLPNGVVVSEAVYRRTRQVFEFTELEPRELKGLDEPLRRYRALRRRRIRGKLRGVPGLSSPLIGRESELSLLEDTFAEAAGRGEVRCVVIRGEAGIGKTRLVEEFIDALGPRAAYLHGRCLVYGDSPAYYPVAEVLRRLFGVGDESEPEEMRPRLETWLSDCCAEVYADEFDPLPALLTLLGSGGGRPELSGQRLRDQIHLVCERILSALAAEQPLVILIEDLQWADGATLELLRHLLRSLRRSPILFIINTRPTRDGQDRVAEALDWLSQRPNARSLELRQLDEEQTQTLVRSLLTIDKLGEEERGLIVERAAGNPFFVEEIIKSLIDRGLILRSRGHWTAQREIRAIDLPDTIEDVLRSRLDSLPENGRRVIQTAAVVGEVFWRRIVAALMRLSVDGELYDLERRELITRRLDSLFADDLEYIFKHNLLHQTAYRGILKRVRREMHHKTARWVEEHYAEHLESYLSLVAHHYAAAGEDERAAGFYLRAGRHAASIYANEEALDFLARVIELTDAPPLRYQALLRAGRVLTDTGRIDEALERYAAAIGCAGDDVERAEVHEHIGNTHQSASRYTEAREEYRTAEELLRELPVSLPQVRVRLSRGWLKYLEGDYTVAMELVEEARIIYDLLERDDAEAETILARLYSVHSAVIDELGDLEASREYNAKTLALYEKHGNLGGILTTLNNIGAGEYVDGNFDIALEYLNRSFEMGGRCGDRFGQAVNCCNLGFAYASLNDYAEARRWFERYIEFNAQIDNRLGDGYAHDGLGRVAEELGDLAAAEEHYRLALEIFAELGARSNLIEARLDLARFLALRGREREAWSELDDLYSEAAEDDLARTELQVLAQIARRRPLSEHERKRLEDAVARADELFHKLPYATERLETAGLLSRLYVLLGEPTKSREYVDTAKELFRRISGNIGAESRRRGFERRLRRMGLLPEA